MDGASLGSPRGEIILDAKQAMAALRDFGRAADGAMQTAGSAGNQAASGVDRLTQSVSTAGAATGTASNSFSRLGSVLTNGNVQAAGGALTAVGAATSLLGGFAINSAMQFEQGMANVSAATGATGDELQQLSDLALQIGKDTSFSATEATLAIEELAKAGVGVNDIMNGAADATTALAAAGGVDLPTAATVMSAALNQFGLEAGAASGYTDEFGNSVTNAAHVADLVAAAASASATGVTEMGESLKYVGTSAAALNIPIEDVSTALAIMANNGIVGSSAGTSLNQALLSLANPTDKARGSMEELGISFTDVNGNLLPLPDILSTLNTSLEGYSDTARATYLENMFGVEGGRAINAMLSSQSEELQGTERSWDSMYDSVTEVGVAQEQAEARLNSTRGRLEAFKGSLETAAIVIGSKILPAFDGLIRGGTELINMFLNLPSGVQTAIAAVVGVTGALAGVAGAAILVGPKVMEVVKGFQTLRTAMTGATVASRAAAVGTAAMGPAGTTAAGGMTAANTAGKGLRATMLGVLGPIALVVAAGAALYLAYQSNFLGFGDAVRGVGNMIKDAFNGIVDGVTGFIDRFKIAFDLFTEGTNGIGTAVNETGGLILTFAGAVGAPFQKTEGFVRALAQAIRSIGGGDIGWLNAIAKGLDRVAPKIQAFVDTLQTARDWLVNVFSSGDAEAGLERFSGALQPIMHGLGKIVDTAHDLKAAFGKGFLNGLKAIPDELGDIADGFDLIFQGVGQFISGLGNKFPALARTFSEIGDRFENIGNLIRHVGDLVERVFTGQWGAAFSSAKQIVGDLVDIVLDIPQVIGALVADIAGLLQTGLVALFDSLSDRFSMFGNTFDRLGGVIGNALGVVRNLGEALLALFHGDWSGVWENLQDAFTDAVQAILNLAGTVPTLLFELFQAIPWGEVWNALQAGFSAAVSGLASAASNIWGWITDSVGSIDWAGIGSALQSGVTTAVGYITGLASDVWGWIVTKAGEIDWTGIGSTLLTGAETAVGAIADIATDVWGWIATKAGEVDWTGIGTTLQTNATSALSTAGTWLLSTGTTLFAGLFQGILNYLPTIAGWLGTLGSLVGGFIGDAASWLLGKGQDVFVGLLTGLVGYWPTITSWLGTVGSLVIGAIGDAAGWLLDKGRDLIVGMLQGIVDRWPSVFDWLGTVGSLVLTAIGDLAKTLLAKGGDLITGLLAGLVERWPTVFDWLGTIGSLVLTAIGELAETLKAKGTDLITGLKGGAEAFWTGYAVPYLQGIPQAALDAVGTLTETMKQKGLDLINGFKAGLEDAWEAVKTWLGNLNPLNYLPAGFSDIMGFLGLGGDTPPADTPPADTPPATATGPAPGESGFVGPVQTPASGVALDPAILTPVETAFATAAGAIRTSIQQIITDAINMKIMLVQQFNDAGLTIDGQVRTFQGSVPPLWTATMQAIITDAINMKVMTVQQFTDAANTSIAIAGGWMTGVSSIATNLATSVMTSISTAKIGVVADVSDMTNSTIAVAGGWQTGMVGIAQRLDGAVRQAVSTMKIGAVADIRDLANTTIATAGGWQTGLTSIASRLDAAVRQSISSMKIGAVSDVRDMSNTAIATAGAMQSGVLGAISGMVSQAVGQAGRLRGEVVAAFQAMSGQAVGAVQSMSGQIIGTMNGLAGSAGGAGRSIGSSFGQGLVNGMSGYINAAASTAASIVRAAISAAQREQESASPSKVMTREGQYFTQGYAQGIARAAPSAVKAVVGMVDGAISAAQARWTPETIIGAWQQEGRKATQELTTDKLWNYLDYSMGEQGDWLNDFGAHIDERIALPLFQLGQQLERFAPDPRLVDAISDAAWAMAGGFDAAASLNQIPDALDSYVVELGRVLNQLTPVRKEADGIWRAMPLLSQASAAAARSADALGRALVSLPPQVAKPPRNGAPTGTGGGPAPSIPIPTSPIVTNPLPTSPSLGLGGGITLNFGGFQITTSGGAQETAGAWGDAFSAEIPAVAAAIRRVIGG